MKDSKRSTVNAAGAELEESATSARHGLEAVESVIESIWEVTYKPCPHGNDKENTDFDRD